MPRSRFAILLAYDGAAFEGWQVQPHRVTVQGTLRRALAACGIRSVANGSGRTDKGVHAEGQVATFEATADAAALQRELDSWLREHAPALVVRAIRKAHPRFHAQWSAVGKRYRYRFSLPGSRMHARACPLPRVPNLAAMQQALTLLATEPSLGGLCSGHAREAAPLDRARIEVGGDLSIVLEARGFGKHAIRNLAACLVQIGLGHLASERLSQLAQSPYAYRHATAPAAGLTLERVLYRAEEDPFLDI